ncbi:hypothetical protein LTR66_011730, partial [Elasticomyces elasticus]
MRKRFHNLKRPKVRADWSKWNLYNLSRMTVPYAANKTFFQQKWLAKSNTRAYHGEQIREGQWTRMFDRRLPSVVPMDHRRLAKSDGSEQAAGRGSGLDRDPRDKDAKPPAKTPYMQMTYHPTERRLDTAVWRALFASSARQARQFVVHGWVKVNGKKMIYPGYLLNPGDMFSVDPDRVMYATGARKYTTGSPESTQSTQSVHSGLGIADQAVDDDAGDLLDEDISFTTKRTKSPKQQKERPRKDGNTPKQPTKRVDPSVKHDKLGKVPTPSWEQLYPSEAIPSKPQDALKTLVSRASEILKTNEHLTEVEHREELPATQKHKMVVFCKQLSRVLNTSKKEGTPKRPLAEATASQLSGQIKVIDPGRNAAKDAEVLHALIQKSQFSPDDPHLSQQMLMTVLGQRRAAEQDHTRLQELLRRSRNVQAIPERELSIPEVMEDLEAYAQTMKLVLSRNKKRLRPARPLVEATVDDLAHDLAAHFEIGKSAQELRSEAETVHKALQHFLPVRDARTREEREKADQAQNAQAISYLLSQAKKIIDSPAERPMKSRRKELLAFSRNVIRLLPTTEVPPQQRLADTKVEDLAAQLKQVQPESNSPKGQEDAQVLFDAIQRAQIEFKATQQPDPLREHLPATVNTLLSRAKALVNGTRPATPEQRAQEEATFSRYLVRILVDRPERPLRNLQDASVADLAEQLAEIQQKAVADVQSDAELLHEAIERYASLPVEAKHLPPNTAKPKDAPSPTSQLNAASAAPETYAPQRAKASTPALSNESSASAPADAVVPPAAGAKATRKILQRLLDHAKSVVDDPTPKWKLSAARKQELRAFYKLVKTTISKLASKAGAERLSTALRNASVGDLETQLGAIMGKISPVAATATATATTPPASPTDPDIPLSPQTGT